MNKPFTDDREKMSDAIEVTEINSTQIECPNCKSQARKSTFQPKEDEYFECKVQEINIFCNQCGYVQDKEILESGKIGFIYTVEKPYGAYCMLYADGDDSLYYGSLSDEQQYEYCKEKANQDPTISQVRVTRFINGSFVTENLVN